MTETATERIQVIHGSGIYIWKLKDWRHFFIFLNQRHPTTKKKTLSTKESILQKATKTLLMDYKIKYSLGDSETFILSWKSGNNVHTDLGNSKSKLDLSVH